MRWGFVICVLAACGSGTSDTTTTIATTTTEAPFTTAVDATEAIEQIRLIASEQRAEGFSAPLADSTTDAQLITKMERFCEDTSRSGIDSAIEADIERLVSIAEGLEGASEEEFVAGQMDQFADVIFLTAVWSYATLLYCPEHRSVVADQIGEMVKDWEQQLIEALR